MSLQGGYTVILKLKYGSWDHYIKYCSLNKTYRIWLKPCLILQGEMQEKRFLNEYRGKHLYPTPFVQGHEAGIGIVGSSHWSDRDHCDCLGSLSASAAKPAAGF